MSAMKVTTWWLTPIGRTRTAVQSQRCWLQPDSMLSRAAEFAVCAAIRLRHPSRLCPLL